jgi:hypothetical protein
MERSDPTTDGLDSLSWSIADLFHSGKATFKQKLEKVGVRGRRWNRTYDITWRGKAHRWRHAVSSPFAIFAVTL